MTAFNGEPLRRIQLQHTDGLHFSKERVALMRT
jgi:hypothetical protein